MKKEFKKDFYNLNILHQYQINRIFQCLLIVISISFSVSLLLISYLQLVPSEVFFFLVRDGWCQPQFQGIGVHCFGDFYHSLLHSMADNPWESEISAPYPALTYIFIYPFSILFNIFENFPIVLIFIFFALVMILLPIFKNLQFKKITFFQFFILSILIVTSSAVLTAIDRGNLILFVYPLVYYFIDCYFKKSFNKLAIIVFLLTIFKPQLIFLIFVLIAYKKIRIIMYTLILSIFLHAISFLIYGKNSIQYLIDFISVITGFQNYAEPGLLFPANISLPSSISIIERLFGQKSNYYPEILNIILLIIVILILYINNKSELSNIWIIILTPIFLTNVTYGYYIVVPFALISYLFIDFVVHSNKCRDQDCPRYLSFTGNIKSEKYFYFIYLILFIPWVIPWNIFFSKIIDSTISMHWFLGQLCLQIYYFYILFFEKTKKVNKY